MAEQVDMTTLEDPREVTLERYENGFTALIWGGDHPRVLAPLNGRPIKSWATEVEEGAVQQAINLARLPFAISHVALMPDAHKGYGMPIGGVLFADRAVVPYAIGVDIGCGVVLAETELEVDELLTTSVLDGRLRDSIGRQILRDVPVGLPPGGNRPTAMRGEELLGLMGRSAVPDVIRNDWWLAACRQVGSLGGGNHFIELQADDEGRIYVMLHSGSRSLGKNICDFYVKLALDRNRTWHSALPHKDLAYLPVDTAEYHDYWDAMEFALRFAEVNRELMLAAVALALERYTGSSLKTIVDCHHNYAAWENHAGKNGIVHRKGAVRARDGEDVLIPGSMGTSSYWARGKGNPDSFETCQHGAGRAMSRAAARKLYGEVAVMAAELETANTKVYTPKVEDVLDEAPRAYKDIDAVMAASTDLVEVVKRLRPVLTVKG